ncbi:MAG: hypothetical protein ACK52I_12135 [Pseudomonadota bacterium]|jgi:hypothetical protein
MTTHFDFHYAKFKEAGQKISNPDGLEVHDFQRWDDIREASITAIAIEAGIIDLIPSDGRLSSLDYQKTLMMIHRYEISQSEGAA